MFSYGGPPERAHRIMCVCVYVSLSLKMSSYSYENSHKVVLDCIGQNNQCLSSEINIIIVQCLFSVSLCSNRSLWEAWYLLAFWTTQLNKIYRLEQIESTCKQQAFKTHFIFVLTLPFLSFHIWEKLWNNLREGIRILLWSLLSFPYVNLT